MWSIPGEDEYWENVRERSESCSNEYIETDIVFLDDDIDELEREYGCKIEELGEPEYEKIVLRLTSIIPDKANYDSNICGIKYKYQQTA